MIYQRETGGSGKTLILVKFTFGSTFPLDGLKRIEMDNRTNMGGGRRNFADAAGEGLKPKLWRERRRGRESQGGSGAGRGLCTTSRGGITHFLERDKRGNFWGMGNPVRKARGYEKISTHMAQKLRIRSNRPLVGGVKRTSIKSCFHTRGGEKKTLDTTRKPDENLEDGPENPQRCPKRGNHKGQYRTGVQRTSSCQTWGKESRVSPVKRKHAALARGTEIKGITLGSRILRNTKFACEGQRRRR